MNKYAGQTLAIVFALLIIGSVIGFALYARMARDSERVVDERASGEANELVETTIGLMSTVDYEQIKDDEVLVKLDKCDEINLYSSGCREHNITLDEMEDILYSMGLEEGETEFLSNFKHESEEDYCMTELAIRSLAAEGVTIAQDDSYSIFLQDAEDLESCAIEFTMEKLEDSTYGFIMSTFYTQYDENNEIISYKPYEFEDIVGFTYEIGDRDNWKGYQPRITFSSENGYPVSKEIDGTTYMINEVRFKSLGGSSNLIWNPDNDRACNLDDHLLVEVGATCGENYVGKSFILPQGYFAPPMFDYVYFQGRGALN